MLHILERKVVGKLRQAQIIATNIDFGLNVQSVNRDFSINHLERYLAICNASKTHAISSEQRAAVKFKLFSLRRCSYLLPLF